MTATPTPGDLSARHVEVLRGVLETAVCPMKEHGCDGTQYPVGDPQGEYHGEQCQWCDERKQAIAALSALPAAGGEPVGYVRKDGSVEWYVDHGFSRIPNPGSDLYTTPQPSAAEGGMRELLINCRLAIDSIPRDSTAKTDLLQRIDVAIGACLDCAWNPGLCETHDTTPPPDAALNGGQDDA